MQTCTFLAYSEPQIELVIRLAQEILDRHPIAPVNVVGHSDVAPTRRLDPGPTFPWKRLYENGIGAWYDDETVRKYRTRFEREPPPLETVQRALRAYGYRVEASGESDLQTRFVARAFQAHFRPSRIDGRIDAETTSILFALLEKYRPAELQEVWADG